MRALRESLRAPLIRGVVSLAVVLGLGLAVGLATSTPASANVEGAADPALTQAMSSISAGGYVTCGIDTAGAAWCWGYSDSGGLGDGTTAAVTHPTPGPVVGGHVFTEISVGDQHACAIDIHRAAWCWGSDSYGELGDNTGPDAKAIPVAVTGGHAFAAIAAGGTHTCALDTAGAAWCWGHDGQGQLGSAATNVSSPVPIPVEGGHTFITLAAGSDHTCGIDTVGAAWCWGDDGRGQLGDGTPGSGSDLPEPVHDGHTFKALIGGRNHTCGIDVDGAAWCWGENLEGQLGNGATAPFQATPVPVLGGHNFTALTAGGEHTCAIDPGGAAWCWGYGTFGQLGNNATPGAQTTPVAVAGGHSFTAVAAGSLHTCALDGDGAAWCWGNNQAGQLGNPAAPAFQTSPIPVAGGHRFGAPPVAAVVTVTVTASSGESAYGTVPGPVTPAYSGWASGDDASVLTTPATCSTTATATSDVGMYATSCTGASAPGYTFAYVDGSWSVTKAHLGLSTKATTGLASLLTLRTTYTTTAINTDAGKPAAGVPVTIAIRGRTQCTATTNASGVATCTSGPISITIGIPSVPYTATTTGGTNYLPASATGSVRLF